MSSPPIITTRSTLPPPKPPKPWTHYLTLDALLKVLHRTILNPFLAWIVVLCLRAQVTPYSHPAWIGTVSYATFVTALFVAGTINHRIAHGLPRNVNPERELVLVTGGASGLGLLIAQNYGMRGASVVVLDVREVGEKEAEEIFGEGLDIQCFKVDVGDRGQLERVKEKILEEVCLLLKRIWFSIDTCVCFFYAVVSFSTRKYSFLLMMLVMLWYRSGHQLL